MSEDIKYNRFEQYEKLKEAGYQESFLNNLKENWQPKESGKYYMRITDTDDLDMKPEEGVFIDCAYFDNADDLTIIHNFFEGFNYTMSNNHTGEPIGSGIIDFSPFEEMEEYTGGKWEINYDLLEKPEDKQNINIVSDERKLELYEHMLGYLFELVNVSELINVLHNIGFTDDEIQAEGLIVNEPEHLNTDERYICEFPKSFIYVEDYEEGTAIEAEDGERFTLGLIKDFGAAYYISEENGEIVRTSDDIGVIQDIYSENNDFIVADGWAENNIYFIYDHIDGVNKEEALLMLSGATIYISDEMKPKYEAIKDKRYKEVMNIKPAGLDDFIAAAQAKADKQKGKGDGGPEKER